MRFSSLLIASATLLFSSNISSADDDVRDSEQYQKSTESADEIHKTDNFVTRAIKEYVSGDNGRGEHNTMNEDHQKNLDTDKDD